MKKTIMFVCMLVCMIATAMAAECNWANSEVRNCDITSNVGITGTHYVANVTIYSNVYVNMNNALILWDDSWGYKLHSQGTNRMFGINGDNIVIDGNSNSIVRGKHGHSGDPGDVCNDGYGTTAFEVLGGPEKNNPEIKNLRLERNFAPIKYYWSTNYGLITNNVIDVKNIDGEQPCHPAIYGTGNNTIISGNEINGDIAIFGGKVDIIDNTDTSVDENCEFPHFSISNDVQHEGIHKYWYGGQISGNTFHNCWGDFRTVDYTGNGYNITDNENIRIEINGAVSDGDEYIYGNTGGSFTATSSLSGLPTLCVGGVDNTFGGITITQSGTWNPDMFYCPGLTEANDVSFQIMGNDITFDCDGVTINDLDNPGYLPIGIYGDSGWTYKTEQNIIVRNCNLWNSWGPGVNTYSGDIVRTNFLFENLNIISTDASMYIGGIDGLVIRNVTGTDCGAGIGLGGGPDEYGTANANVQVMDSSFTGGGCKGYNSWFHNVGGFNVTNSVFDGSGVVGVTFQAGESGPSYFYGNTVNVLDDYLDFGTVTYCVDDVGNTIGAYTGAHNMSGSCYVAPTPTVTPEVRRGSSGRAIIVQQNIQKQAEALKPAPTFLDAIWQVIANIRKLFGLK